MQGWPNCLFALENIAFLRANTKTITSALAAGLNKKGSPMDIYESISDSNSDSDPRPRWPYLVGAVLGGQGTACTDPI